MKRKPEIVVIAGPNGSGKSTYTEFIVGPNQFADESFEYINADEIQASTNCSPMDAAIKATEMREDALRKKVNFAFETVLSTRRNLDLLIRAKENGYFIRGFYFLTKDSQLNVSRVNSRVVDGGHGVPKEKIVSRYDKSLALLPEFVKVCDSVNIWDNSSDRAYRIFNKKINASTYFSNPVWSKEEVCKLTKTE